MKYLKQFENIKNNEVWAVIEISYFTPLIEDIEVFYDEESAINYYITRVNEYAKENKDEDEDLIFTLDDVAKYIDNNECAIGFRKLKINDKFELPENLVIGGDTKKYNM